MKMLRKGNTCTLLVGRRISAASMGNDMEDSLQIKNRPIKNKPHNPAIPFLGLHLENCKHQFEKIHAPQCSEQHYQQ